MQVPTDFPEDIASASCDLALSWRRSMRIVFSTAHLTCESAFFWVKPKLLSNPSSLLMSANPPSATPYRRYSVETPSCALKENFLKFGAD